MQPEPSRSEFLPRPRWRTRAGRRSLGVAIAVTFSAIMAFGWAALAGIIFVLDRLGVPSGWRHAVWIVPTIGALAWALGRPEPATASDQEEQPWSDYAVRAVMVGVDRPRPAPQRAVTAVVFGAPLVVYLAITVILEALGFF